MKSINGLTLKEMIISGANNLFNCYPEVDALNVFPVPDGDTGTNMNLTISSGAKEVANRNDNSVFMIAKAFSKGLLMGARGNSGVILSQIFRGFAMSLDGKEKIGPTELAEAFAKGRETAYKAVMRPVEGTILTVIRESSTLLSSQVEESWTIEKCFEVLLKEARASLSRTPDLLPVLKEVGVVDSGGTGLVRILEGFEQAVLGHVVQKSMATVTETAPKGEETSESGEVDYCTEFILKLPSNPQEEGKKEFVEKKFSAVLEAHGTSMVIDANEDIVKVHIHTLIPGYILNYAQQFGEFSKIKIENLSEQHAEEEETKAPEIKEEPWKEYGIIAVAAGDGLASLFKEYRADYIVSGGQTMNPSTEDFVEAIKKVHARKIFILPNNSNIVMAATQACEVCDEGVEARVIPSKTIPQGLTACMMFNPEEDFSSNAEEMTSALSQVKTGQVTFAIKDTSIDGVEVKKDDFIGISGKQILCSHKNKIKAALKTVQSMVDEDTSIVTIIVGQDATTQDAESMVSFLEAKYPDVEFEIKDGGQPVYSFIIGVE